jgi:hypothetical protein
MLANLGIEEGFAQPSDGCVAGGEDFGKLLVCEFHGARDEGEERFGADAD